MQHGFYILIRFSYTIVQKLEEYIFSGLRALQLYEKELNTLTEQSYLLIALNSQVQSLYKTVPTPPAVHSWQRAQSRRVGNAYVALISEILKGKLSSNISKESVGGSLSKIL